MYYRWETAHRYYEATALKDLWGNWVVLQSWGSKKSRRGGMKSTAIAYEKIEWLFEKIAQVRKRHGYRPLVMKVHVEDAL